MFKLLSRKLLGKNFSNIYKTVIIAAVIGFGLSSMDIKIQLAQSVLILTSIMYVLFHQKIMSAPSRAYSLCLMTTKKHFGNTRQL